MAGKLFMQPARCYHNLPLGQDDEKEGWLVSSAKIYLNQKRLSGLFLAIEQFLEF